MANGSIEITAAGERVILMPHRTVFWPARSTLLLADLHLGKGETLAAQGIPMPRGVVESDLDRLTDAVRQTGAARVLVLGDLLHASIGIVPAMVEQVAAWRKTIAAEICLVPGNHDTRVDRVSGEWEIHLCDEIVHEGPFVFVHDASHAPEGCGFVWSGHVHPRICLKGGGDSLSLPCFLIGDDSALLPAFSRFTSGVNVLPSASERVWGVAEEALVEVPHLQRRERASLP